MIQHIKIPGSRIGVLIGPDASVKKAIEKKAQCRLQISSDTGTVEIVDAGDSLMALRVRDVVQAVGRGFSPEKSMRLLDDENLMLEVIDLSDIASGEKDLKRINGRIIGAGGKTREHFERMIGSWISVYGKTVSILGYPEQNQVVRTGIEMLINGSPHGPVYSFLEKKRKELKRQELDSYYTKV